MLDSDGNFCNYINHYHCDHTGRPEESIKPSCDWSNNWSCMCNDKCPVCNLEIEPYDSEEINDEKTGRF